jgi:hypothetical protein
MKNHGGDVKTDGELQSLNKVRAQRGRYEEPEMGNQDVWREREGRQRLGSCTDGSSESVVTRNPR